MDDKRTSYSLALALQFIRRLHADCRSAVKCLARLEKLWFLLGLVRRRRLTCYTLRSAVRPTEIYALSTTTTSRLRLRPRRRLPLLRMSTP